MLWVILITLLIRSLSAGPEEVFLVPHLEKQVKSSVVDKEKESRIVEISKAAKKDFKAFHKVRKKKLKTIDKMMGDGSIPSEDIWSVYEEYQQARLEMQARTVDRRLEFQELFTDQEWKEVIDDALNPSKKEENKSLKHEMKEEKVLDDYFADIKKTVEKKIEDPERTARIFESMDRFQKTFDAFIDEGQTMNVQDSKVLRDRHATREEMEEFYTRQNDLRNKGSKEFLELRTVAIENTKKEEWHAIEKALTSILSE